MKISIRKALRDPEARREMEKESMSCMIAMYCHGVHHTPKGQLCDQCRAFQEYAMLRTEKCPFMATKTFCSACKVHCYNKQWRPYVRQVMKYAGPRLLFTHPILTMLHGGVMLHQKLRVRKEASA